MCLFIMNNDVQLAESCTQTAFTLAKDFAVDKPSTNSRQNAHWFIRQYLAASAATQCFQWRDYYGWWPDFPTFSKADAAPDGIH